MTRRPIVGILGGMGPAATGQFLLELTRSTPATCDQEHFHTIIDSATDIPDRTSAILAGDLAPLEPIRQGLLRLEHWGADLLVVPCNTAHYFVDMVRGDLHVPLVHIVDVTLTRAMQASPQGAWLTATTATVHAQLYQRAAARAGYRLLVPDEDAQERIMTVVRLVKAGQIDQAAQLYRRVADELYRSRPLPVVTACTELPLAFDASGLPHNRSISSLAALAAATVTAAQEWCGRPPVAPRPSTAAPLAS